MLFRSLGADWHRWSGSLLLSQPPPLNALAALVEERGWWLEAPSPFADGAGTSRAGGRDPEASNPWEQVTLEVGASLIGAALGERLGRGLGAGLAGAPGAAAGSFLGLALGAVLATEALGWARRSGDQRDDPGQELQIGRAHV